MSEEFVEDIISGLGEKTSDATNNKVADLNTTDSNNDNQGSDNAISDDTSAFDDETKSSSTAVKDDADKSSVETDTDSDDTANAPSGSSEVEELASQLGWNKNHKGPDAVDAATYILRAKDIQKTMRSHNKDLKKQLNTLNSSVAALKEHNERVYQAEVRRLQSELDKLVKEKKDAIALADVDKVEELDQQIDQVKESIKTPKTDDVPTDNPVFNEWVANNQWYLTDDDMAQYADAVAEQYVGAPPERVYAIVRQKVAEVFPEKFSQENASNKISDNNQNNIQAKTDQKEKVVGPKSPVEKGSRSDTAGSFTKADLTPAQVSIMNQFVKSGIMTEKQYIADIAKLQGV